MGLLREMGLADIDEYSLFPKVKDPLTAGKHHYPTVSNEHYSPTNPALFALTQSSTNVQICDDYMAPATLQNMQPALNLEQLPKLSLVKQKIVSKF